MVVACGLVAIHVCVLHTRPEVKQFVEMWSLATKGATGKHGKREWERKQKRKRKQKTGKGRQRSINVSCTRAVQPSCSSIYSL